MKTAVRSHEIAVGHRVYGHENKCAHLHGHNLVFEFHVTAPDLDRVGRVLDFSAIKERLCQWLEDNWDHRLLLWERDPWTKVLPGVDPTVVILPCNPTSELLAQHMVEVVGPKQLEGTNCELFKCTCWETSKCRATYEIPQPVVYSSALQGGGYRQLQEAGKPMEGAEEAPWEGKDEFA